MNWVDPDPALLAAWSIASAFLFYGLRGVAHHQLERLPQYRTFSPKQRLDAQLLVLSALHALVVGFAAAYKVIYFSRDTEEHQVGTRLLVATAMGYFLHDLICTIGDWKHEIANLIHHILAITLVGSGMFLEAGKRHICGFLVTEVSTLFLDGIFLLDMIKEPTDSTRYKLLGLVFVLTFVATRVVWLPYNTYTIMFNYADDYATLGNAGLTLVALCVLNQFWFIQILRKLVCNKPSSTATTVHHERS